MGRTFVSLEQEHRDGEIGFWMKDWILEIWLRLLALHVHEPNDTDTPSLRELCYFARNRWLLASIGGFMGCIPHGLDEVASTEDGRRILRSAIESLMRVIHEAPPMLDARTLDLLGIQGKQLDDVETKKLLEVGQAFLDLLDGKLTCTVDSTEFMPGTKP